MLQNKFGGALRQIHLLNISSLNDWHSWPKLVEVQCEVCDITLWIRLSLKWHNKNKHNTMSKYFALENTGACFWEMCWEKISQIHADHLYLPKQIFPHPCQRRVLICLWIIWNIPIKDRKIPIYSFFGLSALLIWQCGVPFTKSVPNWGKLQVERNPPQFWHKFTVSY